MAAALTITGNVNDALAAIAKLERQFDSLENKMKRVGSAGNESSGDWEASITSIAERYASVTVVAGTITAAISGIIEKNTEWLAQLDEIINKNAEIDIKNQIQSGITKPEVAAQMPAIERALTQTPSANANEAIGLQTQIASSGFKQEDVKSGAALKAILDIKAATNQFGEGIGDVGAAAKTMSKILKGSGAEHPTAQQMTDVGGSLVSLFEKSDVQFPDFNQLAPKMAGLKNFGLSMEESLGAFSALNDVMGAEKAATGLQTFVSRTATVGNSKEKTAALAELGLTPGEVEMAAGGKNLQDTIGLMRGKLAGKTQEEQNSILNRIYGEEGQAAAAEILSDSGSKRTTEFIEAAKDKKPMQRNLQAFQESRYADQKRMENSRQFSLRKQMPEKTWGELDAEGEANLQQQNEGKSPIERSINNFGNWVEGWSEVPFRWMGMTPGEAGRGGNEVRDRVIKKSSQRGIEEKRHDPRQEENQGGANEGAGGQVQGRQVPEQSNSEAGGLAKELQQQTEVLKEIRDATKSKEKRPINPKGNVE